MLLGAGVALWGWRCWGLVWWWLPPTVELGLQAFSFPPPPLEVAMEISGDALPTQKEARPRRGAPQASSPPGTHGRQGPQAGLAGCAWLALGAGAHMVSGGCHGPAGTLWHDGDGSPPGCPRHCSHSRGDLLGIFWLEEAPGVCAGGPWGSCCASSLNFHGQKLPVSSGQRFPASPVILCGSHREGSEGH